MTNSKKFKIKFKLQGLELEIEGSREDVPLIGQAVGQQVAGLFQPASDIVEGEVKIIPSTSDNNSQLNNTTQKKKRKTSRPTTTTGEKESTTLDWKHNPELWGSPNQSWSVNQKTLWTMYVAEQALNINELSVGMISTTFNKHFRQAGTIRSNHVSSVLGKGKNKGKESMVGEDTTQQPSKWYLTSKGKEHVKSFMNGLEEKN